MEVTKEMYNVGMIAFWKMWGKEKISVADCIRAAMDAAFALVPEERVTVDMLRAKGWSVATHNDYRMGGVSYTFWLFTKDGRAIKGEGRTDDAAINSAEIVAALAKEPK